MSMQLVNIDNEPSEDQCNEETGRLRACRRHICNIQHCTVSMCGGRVDQQQVVPHRDRRRAPDQMPRHIRRHTPVWLRDMGLEVAGVGVVQLAQRRDPVRVVHRLVELRQPSRTVRGVSYDSTPADTARTNSDSTARLCIQKDLLTTTVSCNVQADAARRKRSHLRKSLLRRLDGHDHLHAQIGSSTVQKRLLVCHNV